MGPGGIEAVGDAITGGVIARAFEPDAGEGKEGHELCLNCGTELIGPHCHNCGQAGHVHRTLTAWWHDFAHGVLHLDGKIWRTLPLLAWRPGELTRRYVEGERARFVSPLALFLFSVFLMFAVFNTFGGHGTKSGEHDRIESPRDVDAELRGLRARVERLQAAKTTAVKGGQATAALDRQISDTRQEMRVLTISGPCATRERDENLDLGWLDDAYCRAKQNPSLLIYKLESNAYKFSWALIPISVPFVWLLFFWKRRYKVYDHIVFVTYSLAFMTLLAVFLALGRAAGLATVALVLGSLLIPPVHMYRQLKGAYQLRRLGALWRTLFLLVFAFVAAILFMFLLLVLGVMG
jgi:hypothetical protein